MTRLEKCIFAYENGYTYDKITGFIKSPTDKILHKKNMAGYLIISMYSKNKRFQLYSHQYAWYYEFKEIVFCIDHINNIKNDNRILNLRSVTRSQNAMNRINVKGISFCKRSNRWIANIMVNYKKIYLGSFINKDDALNCYKENKEKYHIINN